MKRHLYIERLAMLLMLLLLLAVAPTKAQNVVYQRDTTSLAIEEVPGDTYQWELYSDSTVNFAVDPGDSSPSYAEFVGGNIGPSVNVLWKEPGNYFFKVTALNPSGCTSNLKIGKIKVLHALPTAIITPPDPAGVCIGEPVEFGVTLTGTEPWSFIYTDGTSEWTVTNIQTSPYTLLVDPAPAATTIYWIKEVTDKYGTNLKPSDKVTQIINPLPDPSSIFHR